MQMRHPDDIRRRLGVLAVVTLCLVIWAPSVRAQHRVPESEVVTLGSYPNPFNPSTTIRFDVPSETDVSVTVYNLLGTPVRRLVDGVVEAGFHEVRLDASDLPSGIYLVRLDYPGGAITRAIQLMK